MPETTDTIKAKLTPGEFVIRKEAVDMIGLPLLNKINDLPKQGGHSEIDKLINMASLENMKSMYGGGEVKMGYGHGGMVKDNMMGMMGGGMANKTMMGYAHGGMAKNLKPVPEDNPGLGKLPEQVRNRMGYMQEGGEVQDSLMGMMKGGMAKKKKGYGYQDGGEVSVYRNIVNPDGGISSFVEKITDDGPRYYLGQASGPLPHLSKKMAYDRAQNKMINSPQDSISFDMVQQMLNPEPEKKKGLMGLLGFQEGGMVGPPAPQQNEIMQPGQVPPGTVMGPSEADIEQLKAIEAERLKQSIFEDTVSKARNSLELIKLQGLINTPDLTEQYFSEGEFSIPSEYVGRVKMGTSILRDSANARALEAMKQIIPPGAGGYSPSIYGSGEDSLSTGEMIRNLLKNKSTALGNP